MTGLENAQHDLTDAQFSLETAIELLDSIDSDNHASEPELHRVIEHLRGIKTELEQSFSQLIVLTDRFEH